MFSNGFNGYNPSNFNPANHNFARTNLNNLNRNQNIPNMHQNSVNMGPNNMSMPQQEDPFAHVQTGNTGPAKQVMNSQGQNIIQNELRGVGIKN